MSEPFHDGGAELAELARSRRSSIELGKYKLWVFKTCRVAEDDGLVLLTDGSGSLSCYWAAIITSNEQGQVWTYEATTERHAIRAGLVRLLILDQRKGG